METVAQNDREVSLDLLKKYGMKWAVLGAWVIDLGKRGIRVPSGVNEELKVARMKDHVRMLLSMQDRLRIWQAGGA